MVQVPALLPDPVPMPDAATTAEGLHASPAPEARDGAGSSRPGPRPQPSTRRTDDEETPVWDPAWDIVDEWGAQSFPASDPPANW